jgi:hypothetical protein
VFDYNSKKRVYGRQEDHDSSADVDAYQVVPIAEREKKLIRAPKRQSKSRYYNNPSVSKFSDQQIDSSKINECYEERNDTMIGDFDPDF